MFLKRRESTAGHIRRKCCRPLTPRHFGPPACNGRIQAGEWRARQGGRNPLASPFPCRCPKRRAGHLPLRRAGADPPKGIIGPQKLVGKSPSERARRPAAPTGVIPPLVHSPWRTIAFPKGALWLCGGGENPIPNGPSRPQNPDAIRHGRTAWPMHALLAFWVCAGSSGREIESQGLPIIPGGPPGSEQIGGAE